MGVMLYREGRGTRVWGREYKTIVVEASEVDAHLKDGWHSHPDEVKDEIVSKEPVKRTRKTKAESDADKD